MSTHWWSLSARALSFSTLPPPPPSPPPHIPPYPCAAGNGQHKILISLMPDDILPSLTANPQMALPSEHKNSGLISHPKDLMSLALYLYGGNESFITIFGGIFPPALASGVPSQLTTLQMGLTWSAPSKGPPKMTWMPTKNCRSWVQFSAPTKSPKEALFHRAPSSIQWCGEFGSTLGGTQSNRRNVRPWTV